MSVNVEKGISVPFGKMNSNASVLRSMKSGDSFLIPSDAITKSTRRVWLVAAIRANIKIITRSCDEGLRVWRVALDKPQLEKLPALKQSAQPTADVSTFKDVTQNAALLRFLAKHQTRTPTPTKEFESVESDVVVETVALDTKVDYNVNFGA